MRFKVTFEIEGTQLSDGYALSKEVLEEMIMTVFDSESSSPLFDETLDTRVKGIDIEDLGELKTGLHLEDEAAS